MPQHTAELCPECGTPLTATNFCTHCEEQREGGTAPSSNGAESRNGGSSNGRAFQSDTDGADESTRRRSARVGTIAAAAGAVAIAAGAALMSRRRRRQTPRGLLARLR